MSAASWVRRAAIVAAAAAAAGFVVAGGAVGSVAHADDGDSDGTKLVVTVIEPSASPTGTPTATPTATGSATGSSAPTGTATVPGGSGPTSSPTGVPGDGDLGGLLYVSGLSWAYHPSPNPFGGALELWFSVRNAYSEPVDATARFWVTNLFGGTLGLPVDVPVTDLKPGETRTVAATVDGLAQWGLVVGHLTFTPPATLGNTTLTPITREVLAWFLSWPFVAGVGICGVVLAWWLLVVRRGIRIGALFGARP